MNQMDNESMGGMANCLYGWGGVANCLYTHGYYRDTNITWVAAAPFL